MAHAAVPQALDDESQATHDQYQRDAWLRLQSNLARTLDDLYLVCEGDAQRELIQSILRILEETVDDFKLLASTSDTDDAAQACSIKHSQPTAAGCASSKQDAAPAADAAAVISRCSTACSVSFCSSSWSSDVHSISSGTGKPQGSRLSRSSSTGCNLQGLSSCSTTTDLFSTSPDNCKHARGVEGAGTGDRHCSTVPGDDAEHDRIGEILADRDVNGPPEALHHKLSSPDRLRRSPSQTKAASEQRHAKAERLREQLAEARLTRLHEQLAKQQRKAAAANKAQEPTTGDASHAAARTADKHQRSSLLRAAHLRRIRAKAEDESRKVDEVSFINNLTNAGKKADLQQRLEEGEARRAEALAAILARQQEAAANVREAAERRRAAEAERLAHLEHRQRRKQEVQAKMEEERRAAVAAREAARAHAKAMAQQREVVRQQQASQLRDKVTARLKQAAERRLQHLELIRERAALGKDFDRRDSFTGGPSSGRQSPMVGDRPASRLGRPARSPVQPEGAGNGCNSSSEAEEQTGHSRRACVSRLNIQAASFCPPDAADISAECSQASVSQFSTASGASASPGLLPCDVFSQLQGNSQSIPAAGLFAAPTSVKASMKGARRRMAKAKHRMQQPGSCFQEPEQAQQLSQSPEAQSLLASWAPHLVLLQIRAMDCQQGAAGTSPAASSASSTGAANRSAADAPAAPAQGPTEQACACDSSSKSSSATNSPRSSMSSYGGASVSTSTFSSTVVGSPAGYCPANWVLSRSSSCCDCDSQHSVGGVAAASCSRRAVAEEQQREALAALVASARLHVGKQQLLVSHLARRTGLLYRLCEEVLTACSGGASSSTDGQPGAHHEAKARQERLQQARLLELLGRLLELPANLDFLLSCGQLLPAFVRSTRVALDHCNSLEADEPSMMTGGEAASRLSMLLQVLVAVLEHTPSSAELVGMQEELVGFTVAAGLMARLASVFSLFDQPMQLAARPVPPHVLQCLRLLGGLTAVRRPPEQLLPGRMWPNVAPNAAAVVLEMQATSMAGVLSLLTAVLLNASPTCTPAEASSRALPPNFVEAAHLVMAVLNNVCRLDLMAGQFMLSCMHHRMEFYHLISFLLSYCLSRWPAPLSPRDAAVVTQQPAAATQRPASAAPVQACCADEQAQQQAAPAGITSCTGQGSSRCSSSGGSSVGSSPSKAETGRPPGVAAVLHHPIAQLLNQVLLLIGYFSVQDLSNQAMLTWGRSPSILQRLCSLPEEYMQVPELRAVLMPTLLCVCYGAERTCETVAQHFDLEVLLQYVAQQQQLQQQRACAQGSQEQHQQPAALTKQERRRQQRAQKRQMCAEAQHALESNEQEGQLLPAQAQQVVQQLSMCCGHQVTAGPACYSNSSGSGSSCGGEGRLSSDSSPGACTGCRSLQPGRSRRLMFALCRRFPVQLLPLAAQQLQGRLCVQDGDKAGGYAQQHGSGPADSAAGAGQECSESVPQEQQQPTHSLPQLQQQESNHQQQSNHQPPLADVPASTGAVSLQLQIQRPSAAQLVCCEVVACS